MATNEHIIKAPGMLKNLAVGGHLTTADQVLDDGLNKDQKVINQERIADDEVLDGKIAAEQHRAEIAEGGLQVDIDDVDDDLQATKVILNNKVMEIGDTVYDTMPTLNSAAPVTSDGLYRKTIQAEIVVGDPTSDWNPTTAEAAYEGVQSEILLLNAELQAAQLEIGAVQTDLVPTEDSVNMLPSGAIFNYCAVAGDLVGTVD